MIVVATTLAKYVMDDPDTWGAWMRHAEQITASHTDGVQFFAALELDADGLDPFGPLLVRLAEIGGEHWTYMLDDGRCTVTTANRLRHITFGQNMATDYALAAGASHLLFMAADCAPPADALPKLLELDHPLVGGEVPTYCLSGPVVGGYPFPVEEHMATAAFVLLRRDLLRRIRWRWDVDEGMSDDPCLHADARDLLGVPTYVRKDCVGRHYPEAIGPVETRGHDMSVAR